MGNLKFCKVRDVKSPARANPGDAGIDVFMPNDVPPVDLRHGDSVLVPSGLKVDVPYGSCCIIFNKSGVSSKHKLDVLACVIDHGYKGEFMVNLINNGHDTVRLSPGQKLVQLIHLPVVLSTPVICDESQMWVEVVGERGTGGFGSTGV